MDFFIQGAQSFFDMMYKKDIIFLFGLIQPTTTNESTLYLLN